MQVVCAEIRPPGLGEELVEARRGVRGDEVRGALEGSTDHGIDAATIHASAEDAIQRVPELVHDRHGRHGAEIDRALLDDEQAGRRHRPRINADGQPTDRSACPRVGHALRQRDDLRPLVGQERQHVRRDILRENRLDLAGVRVIVDVVNDTQVVLPARQCSGGVDWSRLVSQEARETRVASARDVASAQTSRGTRRLLRRRSRREPIGYLSRRCAQRLGV